MLRSMLAGTSVPGFSHWSQRSGHRAGAWLILSAIGFGLTCNTVYNVITEYSHYPVITKISLAYNEVVTFPKITLCSFKRLHCKYLLKEIRLRTSADNNETNGDELYHLCNVHKLAGCQNNASKECTTSVEVPDKIMEREIALDDSMSSLDPDTRIRIMTPLEEIIALCTFRGRECPSESLEQTLPPNSGSCLQFKYDASLVGMVDTARVDADKGLHLILKIDNEEGMEFGNVANKAGMVVAIQHPDDLTLIDETSHDVMPNTLTSFYLTEYETLLQPAPFPSKCISSWNQTKSKLTEILQLWRFPYSQKHCIYFCQLAKTYRECGGCMWRKFDKFDMMKQLSRMGTTNRTSLGQGCQVSNTTVRECLIKSKLQNPIDTCNCQRQCRRKGFRAKVTAAKWPNELDWKKVGTYFGIVPQSNEHQANNLSQTEKIVMDMWWKDKVYNSLLRMNVFVESQNRDILEEVPKYPDAWSFLSALGGSMSIFMGLSFISLVEIVELLIAIVWQWIRKIGNKLVERIRRKTS